MDVIKKKDELIDWVITMPVGRKKRFFFRNMSRSKGSELSNKAEKFRYSNCRCVVLIKK